MRTITALTIIAAAVLAAVLGAPNPASAAAPTIERLEVDDTRFFPAGTRCDFAVQGARSGVLTIKTWTDESGTVVVSYTWSNGKITYTNPATGASVTTKLAGPVVEEYRPDGTVLVTTNGNDQHVTAPGEGLLGADIGHEIVLIDGSTVDILASAGLQGSAFPEGCAALG